MVEYERVNRMCRSAKPLLDSLQELQVQAYIHIQRALSRVYDALTDVTPKPSKKRGFLADMISKITGLARTEDVQHLTGLLSSVGSDLQRTQYFVSHPQFEKALRDLHRSLQHRPSRLKLLYTRYVAIITVLSSMKKTDRGRRVLL